MWANFELKLLMSFKNYKLRKGGRGPRLLYKRYFKEGPSLKTIEMKDSLKIWLCFHHHNSVNLCFSWTKSLGFVIIRFRRLGPDDWCLESKSDEAKEGWQTSCREGKFVRAKGCPDLRISERGSTTAGLLWQILAGLSGSEYKGSSLKPAAEASEPSSEPNTVW